MGNNAILITIESLKQKECIPGSYENFKDLKEKIFELVNAKSVAESPFWMISKEEDKNKSVLLAALGKIREDKGEELANWIVSCMESIMSDDITELPEIMKACPDRSILPLV